MTEEELKQEAEHYASKKVPKAEMPNMWDRYFKAYLAGAESREKRIAELEGIIKTQNRKLRQLSKECDKAIDRVEVLVKENAELRAFKEKCKFNVSDICKDIETENNLIKAKEIIKEMLKEFERMDVLCNYQLRKQAEQFLKDEGCPDVMCEDCTKECGMKKLGLEV